MEDYVTFEQSIKLKKLGFDWNCNHYYGLDGFLHEETQSYITNYMHSNKNTYPIPAPTLSQVQKWLREIKDIIIVIDFDNWCEKYGCHVYKKIIYNSENIKDSYGSMLVTNESNEDFDSYEEALSMGIDAALELLKQN